MPSWPGVMSRQLDPDRPLWEMHVVEGLEGERTALVAKVHHAILDGVSGASVLAAFLDLTPRTRIAELPPEWDPAPLPSNTQMLRHAASSLARQPGSTLSTLQAGVEAVADLGMHNRELAGRGEQSPPGFFAAPRTSFNGAVSNRKRFAGLSVPLEDVKLVGRVFEATVNDVILACVSGGLRRLLDEPRRAGRGVARGHGAGLDPGRGGDRGAGEPDLGDAGLAGQRHRRPGGPARCHLRVVPGGQGAGEAARGSLPGRPGPDRPAGAGLPGGPGGGRRPPLRQDAAAVQRHRLERPGPGRPALPGREPGRRDVPGRARWPRGSAST